MALRSLTVACVAAAALPWGTSGLRMSASGPPESEYTIAVPINWTKLVKDAVAAQRDLPKENKSSTSGETEHQVEPGKMEVEWEIKDLEAGAKVEMLWDHGCDSAGKHTGTCTFERSDTSNPAGFKTNFKKPLTSKETVEVEAKVKVLFMDITKNMDCPICDGTCHMSTPGGMDDVDMVMPSCPVPGKGFAMSMPAMDFSSFPPPSMRVKVVVECKILRADGGVAANIQLTTSM
mmetsp:Transcript_21394/g.48737  ORF Transcript_21394/g.48737 Transcript_21394/m.48737 type:complete len:234 (-) Transcript_21394:8-709(-)